MKLIRVIAAAVLVMALTACGDSYTLNSTTQLVCLNQDGQVAFVSAPFEYAYRADRVYAWVDDNGIRYRYVQPEGWLCAFLDADTVEAAPTVENTL